MYLIIPIIGKLKIISPKPHLFQYVILSITYMYISTRKFCVYYKRCVERNFEGLSSLFFDKEY